MRTTRCYHLMMSAAVLFFVLCLSVAHVDARGGRGGGGRGGCGGGGGRGGFSGCSRGGSVRQSRNLGRSSGRSANVSRQPSRTTGGYAGNGSVRQSDGIANSRTAQGGRYESFGRRDSKPTQPSGSNKRYTNADLKGAGKAGQQPAGNRQQGRKKIASSGPTASQMPSKGRNGLREGRQRDNSRLNDDQKSKLREKYADSGLTPGQLPGDGDRDRDEIREDWQDWRDDSREDWQNWYDDKYDDYWDDYHGYSAWWYGYPVSRVSYSYYVNDSPPCKTTVLVDEGIAGKNKYYYCSGTWFQSISSSSGGTKYVVTTPPARAEVASLSNPTELKVDGKEYYLSGHVFYQKIKRDGKDTYVTVDAPVGARVATIPEYAVEVQKKGKSYFRFGEIFYQKKGDGFIIVKNPGI